METIHSISEVQEAVKAELAKNTYFVEHGVPVLVENSKEIEFEIKSAMTSLGITATIATPSLTYRGDYGRDGANDPFWEINALNVVVVENPVLNRGRANYATALDVALQVAYSLNELPTVGLATINQTAQGGLVVVTVSAKTNIGFMLEKNTPGL